MRAIANDVPPEIWDLIADFLPRPERPRLMSLNRYFLSKVMYERYGEVRWTMLDHKMLRCLRRLQDSFVAQYVQKLHVQAWFITQLDRRRALHQKLNKSAGRSIADLLQALFGNFGHQTHVSASVKENDPTKYTMSQILILMARALSQMNNLASYYFEWRDLPLTNNSRVFLRTVQQSARRLRRLDLHARITNFKYLLDYVYFEDLEDISLYFNYDTVSDKDAPEDPEKANRIVLETEVAPFINRLASSLYRLSLSVDCRNPMTPLFKALAFLPHLRDVELNMPFGSTTTPPQVLFNFLTSYSSNLLHVKINPPFQRMARYQSAPQTYPGVEARAHTWSQISDLLLKSPSTLSNLESLDIPSTGSLQAILDIVRTSVDTLTRLSLSGRYFAPIEQLAVYDMFSPRPLYARLLHLRIDVKSLTLQVLYDIARHFPKLESLILVTENEPKFTEPIPGSNLDPFTCGPDTIERPSVLSSHVIQTLGEWGLRDLGICVERYREYQRHCSCYSLPEYYTMVKIQRYVRSVRYFRGKEQ